MPCAKYLAIQNGGGNDVVDVVKFCFACYGV